jgi:hypothetical protein
VASVGVIISLIFVGLEIRQNTEVTRAATQHAIYDAVQENSAATLANPALVEALTRAEAD